jgi:hypothetical protein
MTTVLKAIRPRRLQLVDPDHVYSNVSHGLEAYLNSVKKKMQGDYGRVTPKPNYTRTQRLYRGWEIHMLQPGVGELVNNTPYAVYAQGPRSHGQGPGAHQAAAMRRRGWRSITDVARDTKKDYYEIMNRAVKGRSGFAAIV